MADPVAPGRCRTVAAIDPARWRALLEADPSSNALHDPAVNEAVAAGIEGARPFWLEVEDAGGHLVAGMPLIRQSRRGLHKVVSGASGLYGGPLLVPGNDWAPGLLERGFRALGGWRTVRRELVWARRERPAGSWTGLRPLPTSVLHVDTGADFDASYEGGLRRARRKERRRLLESGFRAELENSAALDEFYPVYAARTREWSASPVPLEVLARLLDRGAAWKLFGVRDAEGRLCGAHVCIDLGDELFAWLGTTERVEGGSLATLLIESELRWCHGERRAMLNLGTSADLGGVADFKEGIRAADDPRWILRWQRGRGYQ